MILIAYQTKYGYIKVGKFTNRSIKSWIQNNDIEMYWTYNERKCVDAERFVRTLKNKSYKYMTLVLKNVCIDKLDYIVNENEAC